MPKTDPTNTTDRAGHVYSTAELGLASDANYSAEQVKKIVLDVASPLCDEIDRLSDRIAEVQALAADECSKNRALTLELRRCRTFIGEAVGELRQHVSCGDQGPRNGWPEVNAVLASYARLKRHNV